MISSKQALKKIKNNSYYGYYKQSFASNLKNPFVKFTPSPVKFGIPVGVSRKEAIKETLINFFKDPFIKELVEKENYDALFDNFNNAIVKNSNYIQLSDLSRILLKADINFIPKLNHIEDVMFANIDLDPYQRGILEERKEILFKETLSKATEMLCKYSTEDINVIKSIVEQWRELKI